MGYRDAETALRNRVAQLEKELAQIPSLQERIRTLTEESSRWKAEAQRLRQELDALRPPPPPQEPVDVPGRVLFAVQQASGQNRVFGFDQDIIKIGSSPNTHLRLEGDDVGPIHAVVEVTRDSVLLIDLASNTGTLVNGKKITKQALQPGDRVRIGRHQIVVGLRR